MGLQTIVITIDYCLNYFCMNLWMFSKKIVCKVPITSLQSPNLNQIANFIIEKM